jgi:nitrite reductase (NADH) small subunit
MTPVARLVRVATVGEIPVGRGKSIEVDGVPLAIYNVAGEYRVLSGSCPHEGGPLGHGALIRGRVVCPWHGFDFDVHTGACDVAPDLSVAVYAVRVTGSDVLVELP